MQLWHTMASALSKLDFGAAPRDLHVHLDGSVPLQHILDHTSKQPACASVEAARQQLQMAIWQRDLAAYRPGPPTASPQAHTSLGVFDFMNEFLQSPDGICAAVQHLVPGESAQPKVSPCAAPEIRFCPTLHTHRGMTGHEVVRTVLAAVQSVGGSVTLCALRSENKEHFKKVLDLAIEHGCAVDIAGDEGMAPFGQSIDGNNLGFQQCGLESFVDAAVAGAVPGVTAHAGEWPSSEASLLAAVECLTKAPRGRARVGHALHIAHEAQAYIRGACYAHKEWHDSSVTVETSELHSCLGQCPTLAAMKANGDCTLPVEVCLTSNVGGSARRGEPMWFHEHPLPLLVAAGVPTVLCTDNRVTSGDWNTGTATLQGEQRHAMLVLTLHALRALDHHSSTHGDPRGAQGTKGSTSMGGCSHFVPVGSVWRGLLADIASPVASLLRGMPADDCAQAGTSTHTLQRSMLWAWAHVFEMGLRSHTALFKVPASVPGCATQEHDIFLPSALQQQAAIQAVRSLARRPDFQALVQS